MKHLIDSREPVTLADIDAAVADAEQVLAGQELETAMLVDPEGVRNLIARLHAIVAYTYGPLEAGDTRPRPARAGEL